MKKKILILGGGISKERSISLETAKQVKNTLKKKYKVLQCDLDKNFQSKLKTFKPDIIFNALHGRFGEDGYAQTILENSKVKYTHSGVLSSALAMDKVASKKIFKKKNLLTPKFLKLNNNPKLGNLKNKIKKKLRFPIVMKPINEGSSVDVYISNEKNFKKNLTKLKRYKEILIEEYIGGREIQAAILGNKKLGVIELKPKRKFYDYKAKYDFNAKTEHVIPVKLNKINYDKVNNIALKAHKLLNCKGITRSDFKFYKNKFYLLELNTQPGMTDLSLVPEIAAYKDIDFRSLIKWMIKDASKKR